MKTVRDYLFISSLVLLSTLFACTSEEKTVSAPSAQDSLQVQAFNDSVIATRYVDRAVALLYCDSLINTAAESGVTFMQITGYVNKASILRQKGDIALAYRNLYRAKELAIRTKDSLSLGRIYGNLGHIYYSGLDPYIARDYYHQAIPFFAAVGDSSKLAVCIESVGNTYMDVGNYAEAVKYFERANQIHTRLQDSAGLYRYQSSMALIAYFRKDVKQIEFHVTEATRLVNAGVTPSPEQLVRTKLVDAMQYVYGKKDLEKAGRMIDEAEKMAEEDDVEEMRKFVYYQKAAYLKVMNRYAEAITYHEKASVLDEKDKSLKAKSQLSKIYAEISNFNKQKELELLKEKDQLMQRNINQQRGLLFLFALLVALLVYMVYAFYRKKEIVQQNNLLLQQQKQDYSSIFNLITDGIAILDANNRVIDTNKAYHELLHKTGLTTEQNQLPDKIRKSLPQSKQLVTIVASGDDDEQVTLNVSTDELNYFGKECRMVLISDVSNVVKLKENELRLEQMEFGRRITELKLWALRSQINPHFIFNALNSIQYLIFNAQNDEAITYLTKFSKLLRNVLESSDAKSISLQQEITQLKLYIEIEQLRFGKDFKYEIQTPHLSEVELNRLHIPSMIIQPYVENSLWHGLNHKQGKQELLIRFEKKDGVVLCTVKDNGIGRAASMKLKENRINYHQSLGMSKTAERISLLNSSGGEDSSITIVDLEENGEATGTQVNITMKYKDENTQNTDSRR